MRMFDLRRSLKAELSNHGIDEHDADIILAEYLGVKPTELALMEEFDEEKLPDINNLMAERLKNKPVDKIFNKAYFYGLEFEVSVDVLSPRIDSEVVVDTAIEIIADHGLKTALDLCTGSGCLAVAIKKNTGITMTASDVSTKALRLAKKNAKSNHADITFIHSDMFENITGSFDLIVSNPPYIATDEIDLLDDEVRLYDPKIALDGGELGLEFYVKIHEQARKYLNEGGYLILECGWEQKELIRSLFNDFDFVRGVMDYGGRDRVLVFKK